MRWEWPKLKAELTNLSSSLKLQMHREAPGYAPCTETTIDLVIAECESAHEQIKRDLAFEADLQQQISDLRADLDLALQCLREGKARFAPTTTNSFVDGLLARYPKVP